MKRSTHKIIATVALWIAIAIVLTVIAMAAIGYSSGLWSARAEPAPMLVTHDGLSMTVSRTGGEDIEIAYVEVPPALREIGVSSGAVLLRGTWENTVLVGEAFAFAKDCAPIPYKVRGIVDQSGALVVVGPMPKDCADRALVWGSGSIMRFEPGRSQLAKPVARERPKAKAKPKPKPAPRAKPRRRDQDRDANRARGVRRPSARSGRPRPTGARASPGHVPPASVFDLPP